MTPAIANGSTSCWCGRGAAPWPWPRGCAEEASNRARPRARATAASIPGSAVLDLSEPDTEERAFTDEQLAANERRQGDLLLDAGAGSGKTSVLVERFVRS